MTEPSQPPADQSDQAAIYQSVGCVGCGAIVVTIFVLLALTISQASKTFSTEPADVLAHLQAVVPCDVPPGYRPLNSLYREGSQRMALLAPVSYEGEVIKVDVPLLIQAWSWRAGDREAHDEALLGFWKNRVADRFGAVESITSTEPRTVTVRGVPTDTEVRRIECKAGTLRLVTLWLEGGEGVVALAFIGTDEGFDEAAQAAFVASIR